MTPHIVLLLCVSAGFLLPTNGRIRPGITSPRAVEAFETLSLHVEVDLPPQGSPEWFELLRTGNLLHLPAELVLEVQAAEGLRWLRMADAQRGTVLDLQAAQLPAVGLAELSLESGEVPLIDLLRDYPAGTYQAVGRTRENRLVEGTIALRHDLPGLFALVHPLPGASLSSANATIAWSSSRKAARYRLEIEDGEGFGIEFAVPASRTSITLPASLLEPGKRYDYSLVSEGDTDNELEIEGAFLVRP